MATKKPDVMLMVLTQVQNQCLLIGQAVAQTQQEYRAISNDIDSIKHQVRHLHFKLDAVFKFLNISAVSDELTDAINPSKTFIDEVLQDVRAKRAPAPASKPDRKVRKKAR